MKWSSGCVKDCVSMAFTTKMSSGRLILTSESYREYNLTQWDRPDRSTSLHFYFSSLSYVVVSNHPETLLKWLSNLLSFHFETCFKLSKLKKGDVGGILSLYMGASLISVLEVLALLSRCLFALRR